MDIDERFIRLGELALFLGVRFFVAFIIGLGVLKIILSIHPLAEWSIGAGDGSSLIGVGVFLYLVLADIHRLRRD
jgi:hypothetical protein